MDYFNPSNSQGQNPEITQDRASPSVSPLPAQPDQGSASPPSASSNVGSGTSTSTPRIRRRNRMITSCLECRRRKLKCNKSHPCTNCIKLSRDCIFLAPSLDQASQLKLTEIKEKVGSLERLLERDVAKSAATASSNISSPLPSLDRALPDDSEDDLSPNEDEKDLEPTPLATDDAAYGDDGEDDDLLDLGIQLGKMRITERIGGFFRPKIAQELEYTMSDAFMPGHKYAGSLSLMQSPPQPTDPFPPANELISPPPTTEPLPPANEWLKPGPTYIAPASGLFFGQGCQLASLIDFLPSRLATDRLVNQYFTAVHPIAQIVHRPSFEKEYDTFWDKVSLGIEPPSSVQSVVFAAIFSGAVSMDEATIIRDFGVSKGSLIDNFRLGTETALGRANFLRTTKIKLLQAFVMYLIPLCRAEVSRAHSALVGAAIRMAECMGLHRDGETYGMNPLETQVRRLVWYQLCFLDIRTCHAQGPKPAIWRDDFDTKLPLNIDDVDLHASGKPPVNSDRWTDTTFSLIRFEINEMVRTLWIDRHLLERRKISLTAVLSKIETFRSNMATKYDHLIDDRIPVQKCAKIVKVLLLSRLHTMVLHRYHTSVISPMPDRLRKIMTASSTITLETAVALETLPEVRNWAWYAGALQQYHSAFLLLVEVFIHPNIKEADRIWACLDYIYECDPDEHRAVKARTVLSELQRKTAVYQSMRGMRAPVVMEKHIGRRPFRISDQAKGQGRNTRSFKYDSPSVELPQKPLEAVPREAPTIGKVLLQDKAFSGVSNSDSLWVIQNQQSREASNDSNGVVGQGNPPVATTGTDASFNELMADIDWEAFDAIFPPEQQEEQGVFFPHIPGVGYHP